MREQWKEPASGGKRGAAIEAVFYLEDENGQRLERTQKVKIYFCSSVKFE